MAKPIYSPADREKIKAVKKAVCDLYEITQEHLETDTSNDTAYLRFYCFWLLKNNTEMRDYAIAAAFGRTRSAVTYGVEQIEGLKDVSRDTAAQLETIAEAANAITNRKFKWHIQSINITS